MSSVFCTYLFLFVLCQIPWIIATYLLSHALSPAIYGVGMLLISFLELTGMLCIVGMDRVFLRFFYETTSQPETTTLLYRCLFFSSFSLFILFFIFSIFSQHISLLFHINRWLVDALFTVGVMVFIIEIFASLLPRVHEKPAIYSVGQIVQQSIFLISIILFLYVGEKNSLMMFVSQIIGLGACSIVLIFLYRDYWQWPSCFFLKFNRVDIKTLFYYGAPITFSSSLSWFFFNADKYLLWKWSSAYELGIYSAAIVLSLPMQALRSVFMLGWAPKCNEILDKTTADAQKICRDVFEQVLCWTTAAGSLFLLAKPLLIKWLGDAFTPSQNIFGWLLLSVYFLMLSDIVATGILKSKKTYWDILISVFCLFMNVGACYYFIPRFGAEGAGIANAISFSMFFLMKYLIGFYYFSFKIFYKKLFFYTFCYCFLIELSRFNHFEWQLIATVIFLALLCFFEKTSLLSYQTAIYLRFWRVKSLS